MKPELSGWNSIKTEFFVQVPNDPKSCSFYQWGSGMETQDIAQRMIDHNVTPKGVRKKCRIVEVEKRSRVVTNNNAPPSLCERIKSMTAKDINLLFGEMSAQEMRLAKSILRWAGDSIENE